MTGNEPGPIGEWARRIEQLRETSGMVECNCGRYFDHRGDGRHGGDHHGVRDEIRRRCGVCRRVGRN